MLSKEILEHPDAYGGVIRDGNIDTYAMDPEFFKKYPVLAKIQQLQIEQYEMALLIPNGTVNPDSYLTLIELYQRI